MAKRKKSYIKSIRYEDRNYYLKDDQRSAFGLGWERRRAGLSIDTNPFEVCSQKWEWFREGYLAFRETVSGESKNGLQQ